MYYRHILTSASKYNQGHPFTAFMASERLGGHVLPRRPTHVPACQDNEIEFAAHLPRLADSLPTAFMVESPSKVIDGIKMTLRIFPCGTASTADHGQFVSIFLRVEPASDAEGEEWEIQ